MRDYAKIAPQFWTGETGRKIRKLGPEGVAIALYLLTCPHANAFGMYYLPLGYMACDVGMSSEGASEWLQKVCATGFCAYDDEAEVIWIRNMARFQIGEEVNPKDNRAKSGRVLTGKRLTSFERFWAAFAFAKGKAEAADAWLDIPQLTDVLVDEICRAAELEARQRIEDTAKGKSPKWGQGWLTARRWEDYAVSAGLGQESPRVWPVPPWPSVPQRRKNWKPTASGVCAMHSTCVNAEFCREGQSTTSRSVATLARPWLRQSGGRHESANSFRSRDSAHGWVFRVHAQGRNGTARA